MRCLVIRTQVAYCIPLFFLSILLIPRIILVFVYIALFLFPSFFFLDDSEEEEEKGRPWTEEEDRHQYLWQLDGGWRPQPALRKKRQKDY